MGKMKLMLYSGLGLAVAILCEKIAAGLRSLGSIPILGLLFKGLAFPFSLIAKIKTVCIIALCALIFILVVLPILKKLFTSFRKHKTKKAAIKREDEIIDGMEQQAYSAFAEQSEPHKMDFWS